jgi:hypothetical protein
LEPGVIRKITFGKKIKIISINKAKTDEECPCPYIGILVKINHLKDVEAKA